jgi:hypothetical protein
VRPHQRRLRQRRRQQQSAGEHFLQFYCSIFLAILSESKNELANMAFSFMPGASHHQKDDVGCASTPF